MPEYLAPGVYVEETSFRQKSIEGVSTSTIGFVGPSRFGPITGEPEVLTSFMEFERIYGGLDQLDFADGTGLSHNDLAHAVRASFENGARRIYVARAFEHTAIPDDIEPIPDHGRYVVNAGASGQTLLLRARHPGDAGNFVVSIEMRLGQSIRATDREGNSVLRGGVANDTVLVVAAASVPPGTGELRVLEDHVTAGGLETFALRLPGEVGVPSLTALDLAPGTEVRVVTLAVTVSRMGRFMDDRTWNELAPHRLHRSALTRTFGADTVTRSTELYVPLVVEGAPDNGIDLIEVVAQDFSSTDSLAPPGAADLLVDRLLASNPPRPIVLRRQMEDGTDGNRPPASAYEGDTDPDTNEKTGFLALEDLEDISIVAAPGSTRDAADGADYEGESRTIQQLLISHCERMRYRIAVLDSLDQQLVGEVRSYRGELDSSRAALYYPWVRIQDPITEEEILLPPSGFVTGIYARNDVDRGVHKAPANEVVRLAIGLEHLINKAQQDVLNPEGVNCLRFFEGRGYRVWGARTISSDPEFKYVNVRRYFAYVEYSIDKGTQWAVFEPNGTLLWNKVRRTVEDFLFNEFSSGHLMGDIPDEAYFVRCDRTTMTQNDFDNGRLICLIGIAPLRPAEFVIFRIGQKTLDFKP